MNNKNIELLITQLITELGEDPAREGLIDTPRRVAKAYETLFGGYAQRTDDLVTTFDGEEYDEMIICKDIDFYATCEHHMLPFFGRAHIGYIPDKKIIGISKLPRLVNMFARRLQNQERLTMEIARELYHLISPKGVAVVMEAEHLCMKARGVQQQNAVMTTSSCRGLFKKHSKTRNEFMRLIGKR